MKLTPLVRVTKPTLLVLEHLSQAPGAVWGMSLMKATGLKSGTIYPLLDRLETGGWVSSEWDLDSERVGARRRLYRLSEQGAAATRELFIAENLELQRPFSRISKAAKAN